MSAPAAERLEHLEADVHDVIGPAQARFEDHLAKLAAATQSLAAQLRDLRETVDFEKAKRGDLTADLEHLKKRLRSLD